MSATATRAPCRANVSAAARPMPEPAPVIKTVLSEPGISSSSSGELRHAVDVEDRPGHVVRLLRRQVCDGGSHVFRLAELAQRHAEAEDLGRAREKALARLR